MLGWTGSNAIDDRNPSRGRVMCHCVVASAVRARSVRTISPVAVPPMTTLLLPGCTATAERNAENGVLAAIHAPSVSRTCHITRPPTQSRSVRFGSSVNGVMKRKLSWSPVRKLRNERPPSVDRTIMPPCDSA